MQKSSKFTIDYNIQTLVYHDCFTRDSMLMKQLKSDGRKNNFSEERVYDILIYYFTAGSQTGQSDIRYLGERSYYTCIQLHLDLAESIYYSI